MSSATENFDLSNSEYSDSNSEYSDSNSECSDSESANSSYFSHSHSSQSSSLPEGIQEWQDEVFSSKRGWETAVRHCETQRGKGLRAKQSDRTRAQLICADKKCKFSAHARAGRDGWTTTSSNPHHNCGKSQASISSKCLAEILRSVAVSFTVKSVTKLAKKVCGVRVGRKVARNTLNHLLGSMKPEVAITKIAAWMRAVEDADCESRTMLRVDEDGRFNKAAWSFGHSRRGAKFLRSVFAFDATHLSGKYKGVLYVSVGVDANSHLFPLIFMISEGNENKDGWSTFVKLHKDWIGNSVFRTGVVSISDKFKGVSNVFSRLATTHCLCTAHMGRNVLKLHGKAAFLVYKQLVHARSTAKAKELLKELKKISKRAADYVSAQELGTFCQAHIPHPRCGHTTSNIAESLNAVLVPLRGLNYIDLMEGTRRHALHKAVTRMEEFAAEVEGCSKLRSLAPVKRVRSSLKANYATARKDHMATRVREGVYEVEDGEWRWTADLNELSCTCSTFQEYGVPCSHAMSAIEQFSDREPLDAAYSFVNQKLWAKTAAKVYTYPVPTLGLGLPELEADETKPPLVKRSIGRSRVKRLRVYGEREITKSHRETAKEAEKNKKKTKREKEKKKKKRKKKKENEKKKRKGADKARKRQKKE